MDLVAGATGILGREICRRLRELGRDVRAVHRPTSDPRAVEALRALGVELVAADLSDPGSLYAACRGAETVLSTATVVARSEGTSDDDVRGHLNLIEAALRCGVRHIVFVSVTGNRTEATPLVAGKRAVERDLLYSGLAFTILRPSAFQEVWLGPTTGFDYANAKVTIFGTGEAPISYISLFDVAEFAVLSVLDTRARNRILEIGGPRPVAPLEAVRIFESLSGRTFEIEHVPTHALAAQLDGMTDERQRTGLGLILEMAEHGDPIDMDEMLAEFPIQLTSVREYAGSALGLD